VFLDFSRAVRFQLSSLPRLALLLKAGGYPPVDSW
jgi:hypothetical protein